MQRITLMALVLAVCSAPGQDKRCSEWNGSDAHWFFKRAPIGLVATCLFEGGVDPNARDTNSWTPLHYAAALDRADLARILLQNGADPSAQSDSGVTPLHIVMTFSISKRKGLEMVRILLKHGANPNIQEERYGNTPLHKAASSMSFTNESAAAIVRELVSAGADANIKAADGRNPVHDALVTLNHHMKGERNAFVDALRAAVAAGEDKARVAEDDKRPSIEEKLRQQEEQRRHKRRQQERENRRRELARIKAENEKVLNSDCKCIRIEEDGGYLCVDGFVVGNNSKGRPCDIAR